MVRIPIEFHEVRQELKNGDVVMTKEIAVEKPACPPCAGLARGPLAMLPVEKIGDPDTVSSDFKHFGDIKTVKRLEELQRAIDEEMFPLDAEK
jgi:hypothetical protein